MLHLNPHANAIAPFANAIDSWPSMKAFLEN